MTRYVLAFVGLLLIVGTLVGSAQGPDPFDSPVFLPVVLGGWRAPDPPTVEHGAGNTYKLCAAAQALGLDWYYTWGMDPGECDGVETVPMIYHLGDIGEIPGGNSAWLAIGNEPDNPKQSDFTAFQLAMAWPTIEATYPDHKLLAPGLLGTAYLDEFWSDHEDLWGRAPRVDGLSVHCYGEWSAEASITKCKAVAGSFVAWAEAHGVPEVWITEFALLPCWPGGVPDVLEFMAAMVAFFRDDPMITRWAWFQVSYMGTESWSFGPYCNTSLVDYYTGEITDMGAVYAPEDRGL
jgi:hypothetical protein